MLIRDATIHDVDLLVEFTLEEGREAEHLELDPGAVRRGVEAAFSSPPLSRYWVAESDGKAVAHIAVVKEWSNFTAGHYWWIQSVFIAPSHRGSGLLEQLLEHVETAGRAEGARDIRLYVHRLNHRAVRAYQRCGFTGAPYLMMRIGL